MASSGQTFKKFRIALLAGVVVAAALAAGCGSSGSGSSASSAAGKPVANTSTPPAATENVALKIVGSKMGKKLGYTTPDGKGHDTVIPANFTVKVGDKVTVTVVNYDEGPHTFTVTGLGVNASIPGATNADKGIPSKTTFTFVAKKAGKFRWFCAMPCDRKANGWAMSAGADGPDRNGYMAGVVTAA